MAGHSAEGFSWHHTDWGHLAECSSVLLFHLAALNSFPGGSALWPRLCSHTVLSSDHLAVPPAGFLPSSACAPRGPSLVPVTPHPAFLLYSHLFQEALLLALPVLWETPRSHSRLYSAKHLLCWSLSFTKKSFVSIF